MSDLPPTLTVLLDGLFDYAGLFPPADLDMPAAVAEYDELLDLPLQWAIARFITPAASLSLFTDSAGVEDLDLWCISALLPPADDPEFAAAVDTVHAFNAAHDEPAIDVVELKLGGQEEGVEQAVALLGPSILPCIEVDWQADPRGGIAAVAGAGACAKIRTGGIRPELYPPVEAVAAFIVHCAAAGVPFKATAGLHHPMPNRNETVGADEHGFLGVFLGAAAAYGLQASMEDVAAILACGDCSTVSFDDKHAAIAGFKVPLELIVESRQEFALGFGCCDPREAWGDLSAMSLV
ncbi:MAG: hypothetical protein QGH76_00850 [Phycisphaerales bacterium]|jgi:hypothetical protein|nr:hypothetical protein [Phycisphaerales bacterium]